MAEVAAQQALAAAMQQLAETMAAQQGAPAPAPRMETVKMPLYDGKTDVEDFIRLFTHLAELYEWEEPLRLAKLKTTLTGRATDCGSANTEEEIFHTLRAKFGITEEEAKRTLLAMKTGHVERLRDLADQIQKLIALAYPAMEQGVRATLALDQFKRCVHQDLSVFMISRPPNNLDQAVQLCSEYASAGITQKGRRAQINSVAVTPSSESTPEVNAFETNKSLTQRDLKNELKDMQKTMAEFMKTMMATCADAIRTEVSKTPAPATAPKSSWKKFPTPPQKPETKTTQPKRAPPSPCICGEMHWYKDCPKRSVARGKTDQSSNQENFTGPQQ